MFQRMFGVTMAFLILMPAADLAVVEPKDLAAQLRAKSGKPVVIGVGPAGMYRRKHIPGSIGTGATNQPAGLEALKAAAAKLPRNREVVLYCGCCPWESCPNMKPALALLKQMGFTRVKALVIPTNFASDWIDQGYPVEGASAP
jgi:rhodanese-related sulfurtransferase